MKADGRDNRFAIALSITPPTFSSESENKSMNLSKSELLKILFSITILLFVIL